MTIQQIHDLAVNMGMESDLRGIKIARKALDRAKAKHDQTPAKDRWELDAEALTNPYLDSRILFDPKREV